GFWRGRLPGAIHPEETRAELTAQCQRFEEIVGHSPTAVNSHHHVQVFPPVGRILLEILGRRNPLPYVRRVREPWSMLAAIPGARTKRTVLSLLGRNDAARQIRLGFAGNQWLAGVTDPPCVKDPIFLTRWLARLPGEVVELTCHPGHRDQTLFGRDATETDGQVQRRVDEYRRLSDPAFRAACDRTRLVRIAPRMLLAPSSRGEAHAA